MKVKAIAWRVIVKPDSIEKMTKSGLVIASDERLEKGARVTGTIVDIGPDVYPTSRLPLAGLSIGDRVFYARYAGKVIENRDTKEELVVLNDEDVVALDVETEPS